MTRLVHDLERMFLTEDALELIYQLFLTEEYARNVIEIAIEDAMMIGQVRGGHIDAITFMSIIQRTADSTISHFDSTGSLYDSVKGQYFVH
ncbi:MAG: hypothetical protein WCQ97_04650 [Aminobacterium sp.]|nr:MULTISPECIES: hypothetical protein [unclassified Aminobacterium]MDD2207052.1 hypothetical protein [Aminobacterium sp.]MDD3425580.1 hypothetical protein [Aminobacterium sp.]MDD3708322.1 hypothetical protein [Aminobacterium sp.]MDD4228755.1 hypothetical protein [Aminobacterium sp.]MDD4550626.1 hypothetical protein [Aminobacterium sp.]